MTNPRFYVSGNPGEDQPLITGKNTRRVTTEESMDDDDDRDFIPRGIRNVTVLVLASLLGVFLLVAIVQCAFVIPPGTIGIVVTLGHVTAVNNGMHFRIPYASSVEKMTAKTQLLDQENVIPTKEGLAVKLETAVLFRLDPSKAASLYREVGMDYVNVLLVPETASAVRGLTSESEAKALYTSGRNTIQDELKAELVVKFEPRGIVIEDVLLKDIELPEELSKAIELKVKAEQEAARMEFVLAKERQEAERKAIEAKGVADFQKIVSDGISDQLLRWKGVEATELFANSPNTKIVIVGNSGDGLPVILGSDTATTSTSK